MWMKSHFFVPLAVPWGTGRFGSGQEFELSANAKKPDRVFCDLGFEHTDQALIFGVAPIPCDSRVPKSLAAFALQQLSPGFPCAPFFQEGQCSCIIRAQTVPREGEVTSPVVMPRAGGASSIPEAFHVSTAVSGIPDRPPSRAMTSN
jgi:hypothetical protein